MQEQDFFRSRIDAMINLNDPLAVLATGLPWDQIEAAVAAKFERQHRAGQTLEGQDMFGTTAAGYNLRWLLRAIARLGIVAAFFAPVAGCVVGAIDDRNATAVSRSRSDLVFDQFEQRRRRG